MKLQSKRVAVENTRVTLTGKDIVRLLIATNKIKVSSETIVYVTIPIGGDYSGMDLEIDEKCPVIVTSKSYDKKRKKI